MENNVSEHKWTFQRMGGLYQVILQNGDDICHVGYLDPKLWVALACPSSGLQFDQRTLALLDDDSDGRIRIQEVIDGVDWLCKRIKNSDDLMNDPESLPLSAIDTSTEEGQDLLDAAKAILERAGTPDSTFITQKIATEAMKNATEQLFNGDGILPPSDGFDSSVREFIQAALRVTGGVLDSSGVEGINNEIADAFMQTLKNRRDWEKSVQNADSPFKNNTSEAWELYNELKSKIDDYFLRCEFVAFAPLAQAALNTEDKLKTPEETDLLDAEFLKDLPLSRIEPDKPLNMVKNVNPAWQVKLARFALLVEPVLAEPGILTKEDWKAVQGGFGNYYKILSGKPVPVKATVSENPTSSVDELSDDDVNRFLDSGVYEKFLELTRQDDESPTGITDIIKVERLICYYRHLYRLLMNFVNFSDFYSDDLHSAFEVGTLFIDGRASTLCMPAHDIEEHASLAQRSHLYLLYCNCTRKKKPNSSEPEGSFDIVSAITAGDSDYLCEGRNGIYIDKNGWDWDANVVKIISNPISISQAIWTPYKKIVTLISDQLNKFAGSKDNSILDAAGQKIQQAVSTPEAAVPAKADIGRNVGIFAAVGLALGAIGTALATLAKALLSLAWWQLPLVFVAIFILISGPSMLMAWLKLRQRTLGPLLDASGWAVNGRIKIKQRLGKMLTTKAELPDNSKAYNRDIFDKKSHKGITVFILAVIIGALVVFGWINRDKIMNKLGISIKQTTQTEQSQ